VTGQTTGQFVPVKPKIQPGPVQKNQAAAAWSLAWPSYTAYLWLWGGRGGWPGNRTASVQGQPGHRTVAVSRWTGLCNGLVFSGVSVIFI